MVLLKLRSVISSLLLFLAIPGLIWCGPSSVLYGAVVYIAPSPEQEIGGYLEAEIQKRKLPIILSPDRFNANYVLAAYARDLGLPAVAVSGAAKGKSLWDAKIVLANMQTREIAWSASFHGPCPPCDGSPSRAERFFAVKFAKRFQKELFEHESLSDRIDDVLAPSGFGLRRFQTASRKPFRSLFFLRGNKDFGTGGSLAATRRLLGHHQIFYYGNQLTVHEFGDRAI